MHTTIDEDWAARIAETVRTSQVDRGVVLGFDGVYDHQHGTFDKDRSQLIVPPAWVFKICRDHPELLPGPSINPYRADALEQLIYSIEQGAVCPTGSKTPGETPQSDQLHRQNGRRTHSIDLCPLIGGGRWLRPSVRRKVGRHRRIASGTLEIEPYTQPTRG